MESKTCLREHDQRYRDHQVGGRWNLLELAAERQIKHERIAICRSCVFA